jgi:hypothetical protein
MDPMTMMMMGQMVGSVTQSILGGYQQADQMARQDMAFQQQEFQRQLEVDAQNAIINQQNANRLIKNRQLVQSGAKQFQATLSDNLTGYNNQVRALASAFAQASASQQSVAAGRNMSPTSGSALALMRLSKQNAIRSYSNLQLQKNTADRNAQTQYQNVLNSRDLNMQSNTLFIPGVSPAGDPSSAITAGWLGAIGTAGGAYIGSRME